MTNIRPRSQGADFKPSYHEAELRRAQRARQVRTGIASLIALFAVGWFTPDRLSFAIGVFAVVIVGLIAERVTDR